MKHTKEQITEIENDIKDSLIEDWSYTEKTSVETEIMINGVNYWVEAYLTTKNLKPYNDGGTMSYEEDGYKEMNREDVEIIKLEIENVENEDFDIIY